MIIDSVSAVNLTSHIKIYSVEIMGYKPFSRNNNILDPSIMTSNNQLSFNYRIYFFINFIVKLIF